MQRSPTRRLPTETLISFFFRAPAIPQVTISRSARSAHPAAVRPLRVTHLRDSRIALGASESRSQGEPVALIKRRNK